MSFVTAALIIAVVPTVMLAGGCTRSDTLGGMAVTAMLASPGLPGGDKATGVAVTIAIPPCGIALGAVYVAVYTPPLPPGLPIVPHEPAVPHETDHVTPAFVGSFVTTAVRLVDPSSARLAGAVTATEIVGAAVIVAIDVAVCGLALPSVAFAVPVIVTVPPVGTLTGAL